MPKSVLTLEHAESSTVRRFSWRRTAIALLCWGLSSLGIVGSLGLALTGLVPALEMPLSLSLRRFSLYASLGIFYVWAALAVMTWGWLFNRATHWHWPLLGTLLGLFHIVYYSVSYPISLIFVAPCVFLGLYLSYFHVRAR